MDTIFVVSREGEMLYLLCYGGIYTTFLCRRKGYHKNRNTICCVTGRLDRYRVCCGTGEICAISVV